MIRAALGVATIWFLAALSIVLGALAMGIRGVEWVVHMVGLSVVWALSGITSLSHKINDSIQREG